MNTTTQKQFVLAVSQETKEFFNNLRSFHAAPGKDGTKMVSASEREIGNALVEFFKEQANIKALDQLIISEMKNRVSKARPNSAAAKLAATEQEKAELVRQLEEMKAKLAEMTPGKKK